MQALVANPGTAECPAESVGTLSSCQRLLNDLFERPPTDFGRMDLGLLNLLCAPTLPGSANLNIPKYLARLERLTHSVRDFIERHLDGFRNHPEFGHSEPMWRMAMLVTFVKRDFGAAYNPVARDDLLAGVDAPLTDSRDVFIHGLLDDDPNHRWGTCASIPVLITAVARRLRYPVSLAVANRHLYARWQGRECFNIEASNPMGMTVHSDDEYRAWRGGLSAEQERSGHYLRTLTPAEEFALFLKNRVWALRDAARYDETFLWSARALQFAPDDPIFPRAAHQILEIALKHRLRIKHPEQRISPVNAAEPFSCNLGDLLTPAERSLVMTIVAHHRESLGELDAARQSYEESCRQNVYGSNEKRDLQRFVSKHSPRRNGHNPRPREGAVTHVIRSDDRALDGGRSGRLYR